MPNNNRAFSHDVMAAILMFLNNERAGHVSLKKVELVSYMNTSFVPVNIMLDSLASENALRPIVEVGYQ